MRLTGHNGKPSKEWRIVGKSKIGSALIMAGKMKRPDTLSWSWGHEPGEVLLSGLWRRQPNYGECWTSFAKLLAALREHDCQEEIAGIQRALAANNYDIETGLPKGGNQVRQIAA